VVGGWAQNGVAQSEYQREAIQTLAARRRAGTVRRVAGAGVLVAGQRRLDAIRLGPPPGNPGIFQTLLAYGQLGVAIRLDSSKPLAILVSFSQSTVAEGRAGYAQVSTHGAAIYEAYAAWLLADIRRHLCIEEEIAADPKGVGAVQGRCIDQHHAVRLPEADHPRASVLRCRAVGR
jgi:hypothetical protein